MQGYDQLTYFCTNLNDIYLLCFIVNKNYCQFEVQCSSNEINEFDKRMKPNYYLLVNDYDKFIYFKY